MTEKVIRKFVNIEPKIPIVSKADWRHCRQN